MTSVHDDASEVRLARQDEWMSLVICQQSMLQTSANSKETLRIYKRSKSIKLT